LRSGNLFSKASSAVLDTPERGHVQTGGKIAGLKRGAAVTEMPLRRDSAYPNDYADGDADGVSGRTRRPGIRLSIRGGLVPKSLSGKIAAGSVLLLLTASAIAGSLWVRSFLLHDDHFMVPNSDAIQIAGNSHLTRAQLLSVFGEDVDRNVLNIPLAARRAELESLPWVEHATVMRLLPNRVRVAIVERTPVAFVRQGARIGLVDQSGALFDLPGPDMEQADGRRGAEHYSFPVLTGISAEDPLSVRAARMRIYMGFVAALDSSGEAVSHKLSEVDLSNPDDVKAIIPDAGSTGADILVHFGSEKFLERYHQYQAHLSEWRAQYPHLASVDMRYERQVVLEMQPGAAAPVDTAASDTGAEGAAPAKGEAAKTSSTHPAAVKLKLHPRAKPAGKPAAAIHPKTIVHATGIPAQGVRP
jgi:cell division protein FtsQ